MRSRSVRTLGLASIALLFCGLAPTARACPEDESLERVAVDALLDALEPSPEALEEALARHGSSAVEGYLVTARSEGELERSVRELSARLGLPLRCGRAESEASIVLVAVPDVARLSAEGDVVRGSLRDGHANAYLVFRGRAGRIHRVPVDRESLAAGVRLPTEPGAERPEVHLVADTRKGPRPLARVPGPLPRRDRQAREAAPLAEIRAARAAVRAPPLRVNALLEKEATEHARVVCEVRHASHEGMGGDPEARLRSRGISARVVGEAVARARSVEDAMDALLRSPSHRAALEDRRFTDLGLGRARRGDSSCVVALLAAFPRAVPPSRPPNEISARSANRR